MPAAPEALSPPPGHPRFPLFDGLRALAAFAVVATHVGFASHTYDAPVLGPLMARGNMGVPIFFVISGFLLYRPFVAARMEDRPAPGIARYARRRLLRIVPAYWTALTVLALLLPRYVSGVFTGDWWVYYGFLQNTRPTWVFGGLTPAWSLDAEMGFYVLLPVYALLAARWVRGGPRASRVRRELAVLGVLAVASVIARIAIFASAPATTFSLTTPALLLFLCTGMAMAVLSAAGHGRPGAARGLSRVVGAHPGACWAGAAALFGVAAYGAGLPSGLSGYSSGEWLVEHLLAGAIAALVVAPAAFAQDRRSVPRAVLGHPVVQWLGLISYGIFLWHNPFTLWLATYDMGFVPYVLCTLALSVAAGAASYYVVERPFLRLKETGDRRRAAPAPAPSA